MAVLYFTVAAATTTYLSDQSDSKIQYEKVFSDNLFSIFLETSLIVYFEASWSLIGSLWSPSPALFILHTGQQH